MPNDELKIRRYKPADQKDVFELHNKALKATGAFLGNGKWDDDLKDIESIYINSGGEFLVGKIDDKIVAMGALKKLSEGKGEIKRMRVDPDFQRRGFGQLILRELETRAKELGLKALQLDTSLIQEAARKLYEKNGYKEFNRGILGGLECIYYQKTL